MTKLALSKIPISTQFLIFFCISLIVTVITGDGKLEFYLAAACLIAMILLGLLRSKLVVIFLALALGALWVNFFSLKDNQAIDRGCHEVVVISPGKKFMRGYAYKVRAGNKKAIIHYAEDSLLISDQAKVCFGERVEVDKSAERYMLSSFGQSNVYSVERVEKLTSGKGVRRFFIDQSKKIRGLVTSIYSGDKAALAYGLIFGGTGEFSSQAKENFKKSGTSHLVAVSGYNVSIITAWLFGLLRPISRSFAGGASVFMLIAFYLITGGSASILRAAIMGLLVLAAKFIGRRVSSVHLLLLAATIILLFNPYAVFDWGFQLSFLATSGLFFLSPSVERIVSFGRPSMIIKIFSETLGAQIFVLPIMVSAFGQFSIIAPVSNLFILPFVPLSMLLIAISLPAYFICPLLGTFLGGLSNIVLSYIMTVINVSASWKYARVDLKIEPLIGYVAGYFVILIVTYLIRRKAEKIESIQAS